MKNSCDQVAVPKQENPFIEELKAALAKRVEVQERAQIRLLTRIDVQERLRISRAALYAKLNPEDPSYDPAFPIPIRIGARAVRWIESEVAAYVASLPRTRTVVGEAA